MANENTQEAEDLSASNDLHHDEFGLNVTEPEDDVPEEEPPVGGDEQLTSQYTIQTKSMLSHLSSDYALACEVMDNKSKRVDEERYALVFQNNFPVPYAKIEALKNSGSAYLPNVIDSGRVHVRDLNEERYVVIMTRPTGSRLSDVVDSFNEVNGQNFINNTLIDQMANALATLHGLGITHGSVNTDTIYYNKVLGAITLCEPFSHFCGFRQPNGYEALDRAICDPSAKGDKEPAVDFLALGVVVASIVMRRDPFKRARQEQLVKDRYEKGTYTVLSEMIDQSSAQKTAIRISTLLKGLLADDPATRWGAEELRAWHMRADVTAVVQRGLKQSTVGFTFDGEDFYSCKYLAYRIFEKWNIARSVLKLDELARWLHLGIKDSVAGNIIGDMIDTDQRVLLSDGQVMRIITILDPEGPLRFQKFCGSIHGIGSYVAHNYNTSNRENIQQVAALFRQSIVEYWIRRQDNPEDYAYSSLRWTPVKIRYFLNQQELGFGIERVLYELNPGIACQSKRTRRKIVTNVTELLEYLDSLEVNSEKEDPIDRHMAAFITYHLGMTDVIRVKALRAVPELANNPLLIAAGLLALAQTRMKIAKLPNLSKWLGDRLMALAEDLNSKDIRSEYERKLKNAVKDGKLPKVYHVASSARYTLRDRVGMQEAKKHYYMLQRKINDVKKTSKLRRAAYQIGLRLSLFISYLICAGTLLYVVMSH